MPRLAPSNSHPTNSVMATNLLKTLRSGTAVLILLMVIAPSTHALWILQPDLLATELRAAAPQAQDQPLANPEYAIEITADAFDFPAATTPPLPTTTNPPCFCRRKMRLALRPSFPKKGSTRSGLIRPCPTPPSIHPKASCWWTANSRRWTPSALSFHFLPERRC